jgi:glutamyl-tRNA(Gln) amidotransferase subunit D
MHTSRRDAFRSINANPIAKIFKDGKVEYLSSYKRRTDSKVEADIKFEPKIALLKAFTTPPEVIDWYIEKKFRGLIIEGTGLGHVPTENENYSWIPFIKKAVEKGIFVGMTSQCLFGRVNPSVYRNLRIASKAGAVYLEDMLPEVAYVKLGYVLGHVKKKNDVKRMMLKNLAGEMTGRTEINTFPPSI